MTSRFKSQVTWLTMVSFTEIRGQGAVVLSSKIEMPIWASAWRYGVVSSILLLGYIALSGNMRVTIIVMDTELPLCNRHNLI